MKSCYRWEEVEVSKRDVVSNAWCLAGQPLCFASGWRRGIQPVFDRYLLACLVDGTERGRGADEEVRECVPRAFKEACGGLPLTFGALGWSCGVDVHGGGVALNHAVVTAACRQALGASLPACRWACPEFPA